jgi:hypothetical protein
MPQDRPTGGDVLDPDPRAVRNRAELAAALLVLKARANLSYRRLERVTAEAPGARFGLPFTTIRDYIQGRSLPTADRLDQIVWACQVTDEESRAEWARALRRALDSGTRKQAADPYRGGIPYDVEDAERFHGRTVLTTDLVDRVRARDDAGGGLLVAVGASGAGTTSLLRAGLVASLRRDEPGRPVRYGTPGADPAGELAELLAADGPATARPIVVLDQLEQVFAAPAPARAAFLTMLEQVTTGGSAAVVVVGLRAAALARARAEPVLAAALDGRELTVGPMSAEELREVIVRPAADAGRGVGDGLVELLVHELRGPRGATTTTTGGHTAGMLPLLGLALSATWAAADGADLTVAHYRAGGGLDGAAARAAEAVFGGLTADEQRVARTVFLRLVRATEDAEPARRRATPDELAGLAGASDLVDRLVAGRALTASDGAVEITHDALLHAWPRLAGWLEEDRTGHAVRGMLVEAARRWQDSGQDTDLLLRGLPLAHTVDWAAHAAGDELLPDELGFLRLSLERDALNRVHDHTTARRLRWAVVALTVLVVALVGLSAVLYLTRPEPALAQCPAPQAASAPVGDAGGPPF